MGAGRHASGLIAPRLPDPAHTRVVPKAGTESANSPIYTTSTLPFVIGAKAGTDVSLTSILNKMFGSDTGGYKDFWVTYSSTSDLKAWDFSYWNTQNPSVAKPQNPKTPFTSCMYGHDLIKIE